MTGFNSKGKRKRSTSETAEAKQFKRVFSGNKKQRNSERTSVVSNTVPSKKRVVRFEQLKWKPVSIPEMMDDYSGLYGLQEVEGVEIVKDPITGVSTIRAAEENIVQDGAKDDTDDGADEWEGFDDEDNDVEDAMDTNVESPQEEHGTISAPTAVTNSLIDKDENSTIQVSAGSDSSSPATATLKHNPSQNSTRTQKSRPKTQSKSLTEEDAFVPSQSKLEFTSFNVLQEEELEMAESVDVSAWSDIPLSGATLNALSKLGFAKPTPIQLRAIPEILAGHDVVGKAATGSGKTLAFGIPLLEWYLQNKPTKVCTEEEEAASQKEESARMPVALVISPTRELAHQISHHLTALYDATEDGPQIATLTGGMSVQKQKRVLQTASVVVGTPGRTWDMLQNSEMMEWVRSVQFLVIDEADRLLQDGRYAELDRILTALDKNETTEDDFKSGLLEDGTTVQLEEQDGKKKTGKKKKAATKRSNNNPPQSGIRKRQTLVFSATFDRSLQIALTKSRKKGGTRQKEGSEDGMMDYLWEKLNFTQSDPKIVDVNASKQMVSGLSEGVLHCDAMEKDLTLYTSLLIEPSRRTIVFTNSIHAVKRISAFLRHLGLPAEALHSSMPQKARLRHLERFGSGETSSIYARSQPKENLHTPPESVASEKGAAQDEQAHAEPGQVHIIKSILVTTDVAARGLDIPETDKVIHYHVPRAADTYVHRCGRTARAGRTGKSIILCSPAEASDFQHLISQIHSKSGPGHGSASALQTLVTDPVVTKRVKERVSFAQKLADAYLCKGRTNGMDNWVKKAKEELGIESDDSDGESDSFKSSRGGGQPKGKEWRVRGSQKRLESEAKSKDPAKLKAWAGTLKHLLNQKINTGVSVKYASLDVLKKAETSVFVGEVEPLGWKENSGR